MFYLINTWQLRKLLPKVRHSRLV